MYVKYCENKPKSEYIVAEYIDYFEVECFIHSLCSLQLHSVICALSLMTPINPQMFFSAKQLGVSTVSMVSLKTTFEGVPSIGGSNWGGVVFDFVMLYLRNSSDHDN